MAQLHLDFLTIFDGQVDYGGGGLFYTSEGVLEGRFGLDFALYLGLEVVAGELILVVIRRHVDGSSIFYNRFV
jgi:hypothetical protein